MLLRRLRGLPAQLLLWTIVPLALALVLLSVAGITRHRQAMTDLIEERDRSLTLASANRLGRELDRRVSRLALAAGAPDQSDLARAGTLADEFPGGLALLDPNGRAGVQTANDPPWTLTDEALVMAARAASTTQPQFEGLAEPGGEHVLLAAVPTGDGLVLAGAIPASSLPLDEAAELAGAHAGDVFIFDATGRRVHAGAHAHAAADVDALANLPAPPPGTAGTTRLRTADGRDLVVTYARIEPPGWTLVATEDVRAMASMGMSFVEVLPAVLLFVAVLGLLALLFGMQNVVRPLQELDRRAARVAWGDFDAVKEPVGGVQEMEDLRATLAQMADRIRAYQSGMRDYLERGDARPGRRTRPAGPRAARRHRPGAHRPETARPDGPEINRRRPSARRRAPGGAGRID